MKLLRTIRLDPSDTFFFPLATEPGEWAISGAFVFSDVELAASKEKNSRHSAAAFSAFHHSAGRPWCRLSKRARRIVEGRSILRRDAWIDRFGAPDLAAAREAAAEEIDFTASLWDHPPDTLIAVHRKDEGGSIRETFRSLRPRGATKRWRAFSFLDVEVEDEPDEPVDLAAWARGKHE
jgi:hypothetical protein